jgi:drug/metabolite transporter (DMT)-like permease
MNNPLPLIFVIASVTLYNVVLKFAPKELNPLLMVILAYAIGIVFCLFGSLVIPGMSINARSFTSVNWTVIGLALAVVGIEMGFLLAYRAGWQVHLTPIIVHLVSTALLTVIALVFWQARLGWQQLLGLVLCAIGLVLVVGQG